MDTPCTAPQEGSNTHYGRAAGLSFVITEHPAHSQAPPAHRAAPVQAALAALGVTTALITAAAAITATR
ncbi:hypothetical protein GCM10018783_18760 [Streptomyces griseosporeus]|nr:hypothetical protein GCM10018783_18760 [Streptomyces griseosporeus]